MATDNATTTFLACVIIGFFVIRWLIAPSSNSSSTEAGASGASTASAGGSTGSSPYRRPRPVTQGMIEVVQSIAPALTVEQIRYDLERTGSVEVTIDRVLAEGGLPMPPNAVPVAPTPSASTSSAAQTQYPDLISRYNLKEKLNTGDSLEKIDSTSTSSEGSGARNKMKWSQSKEQRQEMLRKQREEMILRARRKLETDVHGSF
ncbi:hypothetical protein V1512DRAFT_264033 [Lipomyces arxii]|uniref:uncharacterized protein n=1 Tax=Lipomyces arxii TaxID=56418 RepID=UPI0034CDE757